MRSSLGKSAWLGFAVALASVGTAGKVQILTLPGGTDVLARHYAAITRWPDDRDMNQKARQEDIQQAVEQFEKWAHRILRPEFVPENIRSLVFGISKWGNHEAEVLFAEYRVGELRFRITDTPTSFIVSISSSRFPARVTDWKTFITDHCARYLEGAERLRLCQTVFVTRIAKADVFRVLLALPESRGQARFTELWCKGNPTLWVGRKVVVIEVRKVAAGQFPLDPDFGIRQRFPPLRDRLRKASLSQLLRYATDEKRPRERLVALGFLSRKRGSDAKRALSALISAYATARSETLKMEIIQTMAILAKKAGGESVDRVRAIAAKELSRKNSTKFDSVLRKVVKTLGRQNQTPAGK